MTGIEWIALVLGIACVALGVVRSVWTFPTAIGSVVLVGIVAARSRLYSDVALQVFFVGANVYGWRGWVRSAERSGAVVVERLGRREAVRWAAFWLIGTIAWAWPMHRFTDAAFPWWDAPTAAGSVVAQLLMARRRLENWVVWIAVDLALIPLYLVQHLGGLALLYVIYLALSIWGLADWRRADDARRRAAGEPATAP